jgi:hypothetical protein
MRRDILLFLGLLLVIGAGATGTIVFVLGSGDGDDVCDRPLAPLGTSDVSEQSFQSEDVHLTRVVDFAARENLVAAEGTFFSHIHSFIHNIDPPIRATDGRLAKELCQAVLRIEEEFAGERRTDVIAAEAARMRDIVRDGAEAMGYARPGE